MGSQLDRERPSLCLHSVGYGSPFVPEEGFIFRLGRSYRLSYSHPSAPHATLVSIPDDCVESPSTEGHG